MAGPASSVLLKAIPDRAMLAAIDAVIEEFAEECNGNDFYVKAIDTVHQMEAIRPFGFEIIRTGEEGFYYTSEELQSLASHSGLYPLAEVSLFSMCNDAIDHRYLGIITLRMAEAIGGLINFGGELPIYSISKLKGTLYAIEYIAANGGTAIYHVGDQEFMREWLQHGQFRMVK